MFLVSHAISSIEISGIKAKYLVSRVFVIVGQYYSEDRVFSWVLRLVFAWITLKFYMRHDYCTCTRLYAGTEYVS